MTKAKDGILEANWRKYVRRMEGPTEFCQSGVVQWGLGGAFWSCGGAWVASTEYSGDWTTSLRALFST